MNGYSYSEVKMKSCLENCTCVSGGSDAIPHKCVICDMEKVLKVLADATRLKILYSLLDGEKCVFDIQADVNMSQSAVSHQLRVLRNNNLVKRSKDSTRAIYALADDHVKTILEMVFDHVSEE